MSRRHPARWHVGSGSAHCRALRRQPCVYCGRGRGTVDHLRPRVRGGHWEVWNLVPACETCNVFKGGRLLTELANERPDLVLHALLKNPLARLEWLRLTMPVDLCKRFDRALGYTVGTPLIGPLRLTAYQRSRPPRKPRVRAWAAVRATYDALGEARQLDLLRGAPPLLDTRVSRAA
ncbi:HNH endonuclease [Mycolicibacterium porcinum]|uniref:HNH endonuclease n=1 Tax=Mycolicibacterium porcinum TaxID=39693 RepID=A0ABV3V6R6_9MYCO